MTSMRARGIAIQLTVWTLLLPGATWAQRNGQPAVDQLGQEDIWGNPTFVGGVTNGGPGGHSIW